MFLNILGKNVWKEIESGWLVVTDSSEKALPFCKFFTMGVWSPRSLMNPNLRIHRRVCTASLRPILTWICPSIPAVSIYWCNQKTVTNLVFLLSRRDRFSCCPRYCRLCDFGFPRKFSHPYHLIYSSSVRYLRTSWSLISSCSTITLSLAGSRGDLGWKARYSSVSTT